MTASRESTLSKADFSEPLATRLLVALLSVDAVFIVVHLLRAGLRLTGNDELYLATGALSVTADRGYPEMFQYLEELGAIVLAVSLFRITREWGFLAWALLFGYLLADDAGRIHERSGQWAAANLDFAAPFGLEVKDLGELAVTALAGVALIGLIAAFYLRGSTNFRRITHDLLLLIAALTFFGVVVDMFHAAIHLGREFGFVLGTVEDGGEMLAVSTLAWYLFFLRLRRAQLATSLAEALWARLRRRAG